MLGNQLLAMTATQWPSNIASLFISQTLFSYSHATWTWVWVLHPKGVFKTTQHLAQKQTQVFAPNRSVLSSSYMAAIAHLTPPPHSPRTYVVCPSIAADSTHQPIPQ